MYAIRSYYETTVFGIRVFAVMGIKNIILTNAAGGINTEFEPGDLMIINDHLGRITSYNVCYTKLLRPFIANTSCPAKLPEINMPSCPLTVEMG